PEDVARGAALGLNASRFSVAWSRIEPAEGELSRGALDHYRRMAGACREHGLVPVVTIHHFTHPRWLAADGCWEAPRAPDRFARLAEQVARHLGDLAGMVVTLNEPNVVATMGWRLGLFPPRVQDRARHEAVNAAIPVAPRWRDPARAVPPGVGRRLPRGDGGGRLRRGPDLHPGAGGR
ncbi:MAG: family 1 glycosylhydrolase, partial [Actinomycetota bacterium]|nr:family 1 glycosylhydrolase [Actinomycetota bacterium]